MTETLGALLFVLAVLLSPKRCPRGWYLDGVRPSGIGACRLAPPPGCGEPVPPHNQPCATQTRPMPIAIYCTGGSRPVVVDERTVGCQRR
jgi:hypothetical protein